jgi:hypothetical protein
MLITEDKMATETSTLSNDTIEKLKKLLGNLKVTGVKLDLYALNVRKLLNNSVKG